MKKTILFFCLTLGLSVMAFAQDSNPTKWTISAEKVADGEYKIMLQVKLTDVWAIYSQHLESDEGPIATSINFEKNDAAEFQGTVEELGEKLEIYDEMFEMNIVKYKHEVVFVQTVKAPEGTRLKGNYEFMVCNDERCLPPREVEFELVLE
jgi:DsbC/DsbD-like thiol-disulfide interchange protein